MKKKFLIAMMSLGALAACGEKQADMDPANSVTVAPALDANEAQPKVIARNPLKNAYFGDVHVHTGNSFDAYVFGVRRTPDDAYRFARGESIHNDGGFEIQLEGPPLDFLAVTDHGEYLGIVPAMNDPDNPLSQTEIARTAFGADRAARVSTFQKIGLSFVTSNPIAEINDLEYSDSVWAATVDAAERHNEPGVFTTFAGYEFTAMRLVQSEPSGAINLHRNVLFKGDAPERLFTTLDSPNPEDLWRWMEAKRGDGQDALSIPHNSNASNGEMFAQTAYDGSPLTPELAALRKANEPLVEITQIKGTSDSHPSLSPNDEWADFERYEVLIGSTVPVVIDAGSFVRPSLARGLGLETTLGSNPYEMGVIGSSDTHIAAGSFLEEKHWGKFPADGTPVGRNSVLPEGMDNWEQASAGDDPLAGDTASHYSASGLAGVWAPANTREDLFDAMRNRETFGTSGPRITVRLFAGNYADDIIGAPDALEQAYANGEPMGSVINNNDEAPVFFAMAAQDPRSYPLQRMQIIKVWDNNGESQEAVYDIACSGDTTPDPTTHRCPDNGASVDTSNCDTVSGTGAASLIARWQDPAFTAGQPTAYYVRVLENPSCRWSTWDAIRNDSPPNPALPLTLQERAWSSPIWIK